MSCNVVLCGLPKSGKTTVGKELAKRLEMHFIDTDRCIEQAFGSGLSCREIFIQEGELFFRRLEGEQIAKFVGTTGTVISLGGGALTTPEIQRLIQSLGVVIYLNASFQEAWERLMQDGIPPYVSKTDPWNGFVSLAQQRILSYERIAHHSVVTTGLTVGQIVDLIVKYVEAAHGE